MRREDDRAADARTIALRARPAGRKGGRRPKLSREQQAAIVDAVRSGQRTAAQLARHYQVSEPTVSRILAAHRRESGLPSAAMPPDAGGERIMGILPVTALDQRCEVVPVGWTVPRHG